MARKKRESGIALKKRLFDESYRFSFFRAVHLLESILPEANKLGETLDPEDEAVRFSVQPGFVFPASDIANLKSGDKGGPPIMEVPFLGLIGPSGVLPQWYNDLALERAREKDMSLSDFLDLFHHRFISLFYLAWKKYNFPENHVPGAKDDLSMHFLSLIGLGTPGLLGTVGLTEEPLIFYSGYLSKQIPSVVAIESTVEFFAGTKTKIDQLIERSLPLNPEDWTLIGRANSELGISTTCGSTFRESQTKFRVNLGPVGFRDFIRFLPDGDMLEPVFSLVEYMVGVEYDFDVRIRLKRHDVPLCCIGQSAGTDSGRLGWSTWLKAPGFAHEEDPYVTFGKSDVRASLRKNI